MRLTQRLLAGSFIVVGLLVAVSLVLVDRHLRTRLTEQATETLLREARLVASLWVPAIDPDSLADVAGGALDAHVTLILPDGRVAGDSEHDRVALQSLDNQSAREEVAAARDSGRGVYLRPNALGGDVEMYAAVKSNLGIVRVSAPVARLNAIVDDSRFKIAIAGGIALFAAVGLAALFSRAVSQPVEALRDVAQSIAGGDLTRRPPLTAPGEVGELSIALHRLTEQLSARLDALRREQTLLAELTESLNEGAVAIDARQQVVRINDTARRLLGARQSTPFSVEQLPRDRTLRAAIADALAGRSTDDAECVVQDRTLRITARPLAGGGAVVALLDLTPLRRVDAVRRDFVANVSHELRTPLTVVSGFAETLAGDDVPPALRTQFARSILTNTRRMQRIVDDLLDLSRIQSGGWVPNPAMVDVAAAVSDTVTEASDAAARRGVSVIVDIADDARTVWADPTAIRQIVDNLVDNAVRHTSAGTIAVFTRRNRAGVELGVRDTGSGIPREHLPRIFERFYRVDAGRSREEGGTGLGLSIVRHLVDAHGGSVRAESEVGVGTTVTAMFPDPPDER